MSEIVQLYSDDEQTKAYPYSITDAIYMEDGITKLTDKLKSLDNKNISQDNLVEENKLELNKLVTDSKEELNKLITNNKTELDSKNISQDNLIQANKSELNKLISDNKTELDNKNISQDKLIESNKLELDNKNLEQDKTIAANKAELDKKNTEQYELIQSNKKELDSKNIEQDSRLNNIEHNSKVQRTILNGLFNENGEGRLAVEGSGNDFKLEQSRQGIAEIENMTGTTLVNVCDQNDSIPITKSYVVEGTNHIALQGEYDGKARPNIHGNTLVNVSSQKEKAPITLKYDDISGNEGKLLVGDVVNKAGHVEIAKVTGNTLVNVATQKELVPITKKYDDIIGNEGKLLVGSVANKKGHVEVDKILGNTLVNLSTGNRSRTIYPLDTTKTYTVIVECVTTASCDMVLEEDVTWSTLATFKGLQVGYNRVMSLITFDSKYTGEQKIQVSNRVNGAYDSSISVGYIKIIILEGDYTNKPIPSEYIEGLQSSFESNLVTQEMINEGLEDAENLDKYKVPVRVVGKNLFGGSIQLVTGNANLRFIGFNFKYPGEYTISFNYEGELNNSLYLGNGNYKKQLVASNNKVKTTISVTDYDIECIKKTGYFHIYRGTGDLVLPTNIQIEEGTVATDYEDYFERTTNVYLNSPLLENDEIVMKDGELCHYHKRIENVLDASDDEAWYRHSNTTDTLFCAWMGPNNTSKLSGGHHIVDKFGQSPSAINNTEGFSFTTSGFCYLYIYSSRLSSTTNTEGFKAWLRDNPIKVVYELAEPWYEPIQTDKLLLECANDSTIHIDTIVPIESISFKSYEEELKYLYTSKVYTIQFNADSEGACDITLGGAELLNQSVKKGLNKFNITTLSTLVDNKLIINGEGFNVEEVAVVDTESNFDYFEGLESSFEENLVTQEMVNEGLEGEENLGKYKVPIKVVGKNRWSTRVIDALCDLNNWEGTSAYRTNKVAYDLFWEDISKNNSITITTNVIDVPPNFYPILTFKSLKTDSGIASGNILVAGIYNNTTDDTLHVPNKVWKPNELGSDFTFVCYVNNWNEEYMTKLRNVLEQNMMIEIGTTSSTVSNPTPYEEYFERTTNVYLNSPFLKDDELVYDGGDLRHWHNRILLTKDNLTVVNKTKELENTIIWEINVPKKLTQSSVTSDLICNRLTFDSTSGDYEHIRHSGSTNGANLVLFLDKNKYVTKEDVTNFIINNDLKCVAKLFEPYYEVIQEDKLLLECANNSTIHIDTVVPVESISFKAYEEELKYLYTSKDYKVKFESDAIGTCDITLGGTKLVSQSIKVGINEFSITTPATLTDNKLVIEGEGFNIEKVSVVDTVLDFDYFEGIYSCFENQLVTDESDPNFGKYKVDYKVTGKNKFDISKVHSSMTVNVNTLTKTTIAYNTSIFTNTVGQNTKQDVTKLLKLNKGTYAFSCLSNDSINFLQINSSGNVEKVLGILFDRNGTTKITFTLTSDAYIDIKLQNPSINYIVSNIQIEKVESTSSSATDYEPYKEYIKTLYLNSPLLKGDTIEENTTYNRVNHAHRYKQEVFDGSEDEVWSVGAGTNENYFEAVCHLSSPSRNPLICDTIPNKHNYATADCEFVRMTEAGLVLVLDIAKLSSADLIGLKAFLQENPITVVYKLASTTYESISQDDSILIDSYVNGHLDLNSNIPVEKVVFERTPQILLNYLYPSTSYTIQFESDNVGVADMIYICSYLYNKPIVKGVNKFTLTTPSTINENKLFISGIGFNASNISVVATELNYSHFNGMQSSFEDNLVTEQMVTDGIENKENLGKYKVPIKLIGKNKCDGVLAKGYLLDATGEPNNTNYGRHTPNYQKVLPNTSYICSCNNLAVNKVYFYDKGKNYLGCKVIKDSFTTPFNCVYVRLRWYSTTEITIEPTNIQIEEGTVVTDYEDYFERTTNAYLNSPLLEGDEIVMKDGELCHYHDMKDIVLDITNYTSVSTLGNIVNVIYFNNIVSDKKFKGYSQSEQTIISDKLKPGIDFINWDRVECEYSVANSKTGFWIFLPKSIDPTTWLQANPITVVYELAEPYYESIKVDNLILESINDATIHIDTIIPLKYLKASYTGKVQNLYSMAKNIETLEDTNVDILATSWDTDYRVCEIEWTLEALTGSPISIDVRSTNNLKTKGVITMALSRFEQAKIIINGDAYYRPVFQKQLERYLEKNYLTQEEFDILIAMMDEKDKEKEEAAESKSRNKK